MSDLTMFQQILIATVIVVLGFVLLYPYYSIWDIHKSIDKLTEEVRKLRKGEKDG